MDETKVIDKQKLAYGVFRNSGDLSEETVGGWLAIIFQAVERYEDYIAKLVDDDNPSGE